MSRLTAVMLFTILAITTVPTAHAACTNASLTGVYGIVFNGLNGQGQPTTGVFQFTSNGAGTLTAGTAYQSTDGTITPPPGVSFTGTYMVVKNCTGTATITPIDPPGGYNFVLDNGNKGSYWFNTDSGKTRGGYAVAQGLATCTDLGVKHTYAIEATGIIVCTGNVVYVGQLVLNGTGGITAGSTLSTSVNGAITSDEPITSGTYSINSNCIGTASITLKNSTTMNFDLIVVDGGKELMVMESDSGTVVSGLAQE